MTDETAGKQTSTAKPLRIVFGCDTFTPDINGAARFTERLAAGLVARGHDVHIVAPAPASTKPCTRIEVVEGEPMTVHRLPSHKLWVHEWVRFVFPWRSRYYAKKVLAELDPDIVHIQSHIVIGRGLAYEAQARGIPVIATNHTMPENIVDLWSMPHFARRAVVKWGWWAAEQVLRTARAITTPTRRAADLLERSTPRRGVLAVSCGIDASQYTPDFTERSERRIVFVGRMTQEKHVDVLLRALTRLPDDVSLDLVGQGDQTEHLQGLAESLGLQGRVVFHGKSTDEHLRAVLTNGTVFAIASIAELQSIATMEAMASGLPVVAADAMALPHLVDVGRNGYLFAPGDDQELAQRITQILDLPHDQFVEMQKASLKGVEIHDIARTLNTFERLYRGESVTQ